MQPRKKYNMGISINKYKNNSTKTYTSKNIQLLIIIPHFGNYMDDKRHCCCKKEKILLVTGGNKIQW